MMSLDGPQDVVGKRITSNDNLPIPSNARWECNRCGVSWDFWRGVLVGAMAVVGLLMVFSLASEVRGIINAR